MPEMPFADHRRLIAGRLEGLRHEMFIGMNAIGHPRHDHAVRYPESHGVAPRHEGCASGRTDRRGVEAVECAIAIQKALQTGEQVPLRIGLHLGDIVFDGTDIYGDGVNVTSRIESMGVAGSILLSGKLNEEIMW